MFKMTTQISIIIFLFFLSCSPRYLAIYPTDETQNVDKLPENFPNESILNNCEGLQVSKYSIQLDCGNFNEISMVGFDMENKSESHKKIMSSLYPNEKYSEFSAIQLPLKSKSFEVLSKAFDPSAKPVKIIVTIVPNKSKGLLAIIYNGFDLKFGIDAITFIAYNGIKKKYVQSYDDAEVNFIGRKFAKHASCWWNGPRNLSCYSSGQMNWSLHDSLAGAKNAIKVQFNSTIFQNKPEVLSDDSVQVVFENEPTIARRVKFKLSPMHKIMFAGKSNILVVYYIATEVRGKFIHWIGSFWEDQAPPDDIPALLSEVLELPDKS